MTDVLSYSTGCASLQEWVTGPCSVTGSCLVTRIYKQTMYCPASVASDWWEGHAPPGHSCKSATYLYVGQVDELRLSDGFISFPEHALLEQQSALLQVLLLVGLDLVQDISNILVIIQQHVLIWTELTHICLAVHRLHGNPSENTSKCAVYSKIPDAALQFDQWQAQHKE